MTKITHEQFMAQWVPGKNAMSVLSRFDYNIFDFTTEMGLTAKRYFESSFDRGGFDGEAWAVRTSRWGRKFQHPVMNDTGTLKGSLQSKKGSGSYGTFSKKGAARPGTSYSIWTTERSSAEKGKRGKNSNSNGSYAAIHNSDPSKNNFTRNQHTSLKPERRQFMGHSKSLDDQFAMLTNMLFKGMPGDFT